MPPDLFGPVSFSSTVDAEQNHHLALLVTLQLQVLMYYTPALSRSKSIQYPDLVMVCQDDSFGPFVYTTSCKRFDFSFLFESGIFAILPNSLFLFMSFARLVVLYRRPPKARWTLRHSISSVSTTSTSTSTKSVV